MGMKRLTSVETEEYSLEVGECDCGYHFGVDASYLIQVGDISFRCPSCNKEINSEDIFPEDELIPFDRVQEQSVNAVS